MTVSPTRKFSLLLHYDEFDKKKGRGFIRLYNSILTLRRRYKVNVVSIVLLVVMH